MSWSVGKLNVRKVFIPSIKDGKPTTIPVELIDLPINHTNLDGTVSHWTIGMHRGKFSLRYTDSVVNLDKWGYHRPLGTKIVQNKDTGLDAKTLMIRLRERFPVKFIKEIIVALNG